MSEIKSDALILNVDPALGVFSITPVDKRFPSLSGIRMVCAYRRRGENCQLLADAWSARVVDQGVQTGVAHGEIEMVSLQTPDNRHGLSATLTFGIAREYPLAVWKVKLVNYGSESVDVNRLDMLKISGDIGGRVAYPRAAAPADLGFFSNGWQSWSPTGWHRGDARMNISRLGLLQHPMIYNHGTPRPKRAGEFSSDMFAVIGDRQARTGMLIGFLSQKNHFGSIYADLNRGTLQMWANGDDARLDPGCEMETDWAVFTPLLLDHRDPLEVYLEAAARENQARLPHEVPAGWCSWYHFYTKVTAENITQNLESILAAQDRLPLELVQIDDGYQARVGDWLSINSKFPDGMSALSDKISAEGLIPGLWQAPFIVDPRSELIRNHPDWILRDKAGRQVNAGFVWNRLQTALDLTVPEALDYAREVVRTAATDWGYPYLKLDFLYAAALKGTYHDPTLTRAQVLRKGLEALRKAAGPAVTLLGCGVPLGSALGVVDLMRIGADVSGDWDPSFNGIKAIIHNEPAFPCARNSIHNIITRASMNGKWWGNDPDCLLIRPGTNLSLAEVHTLAATIAMTGGSVLLSDDLPGLPDERLRIAEALLPIIRDPARVIDWFDAPDPSRLRVDLNNASGEWHLLAAVNWENKPVDFVLRPGDFQLAEDTYLYREFWNGSIGKFSQADAARFASVPPHGCILLSARRFEKTRSLYLGSSLHFSQGIEISDWMDSEEGLAFSLRLPRVASGDIYLYLPAGCNRVLVNGEDNIFEKVTADLVRVPLQLDGFALIRVI